MIPDEKFTAARVGVSLRVTCHFSLTAFKVLFVFHFYKFNCDVSWCGFLLVYLGWYLVRDFNLLGFVSPKLGSFFKDSGFHCLLSPAGTGVIQMLDLLLVLHNSLRFPPPPVSFFCVKIVWIVLIFVRKFPNSVLCHLHSSVDSMQQCFIWTSVFVSFIISVCFKRIVIACWACLCLLLKMIVT